MVYISINRVELAGRTVHVNYIPTPNDKIWVVAAYQLTSTTLYRNVTQNSMIIIYKMLYNEYHVRLLVTQNEWIRYLLS